MIADLTGRTVVIVAVAAPLGDALVEAFAGHGAIVAAMEQEGLGAQLDELARDRRHLEALIVGASEVPLITRLEDYSEAQLLRAVSGGAWPAVSCLLSAKSALGRFPRHTIALSPSAVDRAEPGADLAAAAGAGLEMLCRYWSPRLATEGAHFNLIRHRPIATPGDVANAAVALCSGWMDAMCGQVLTVDRGAGFCDNVFRLFAERAQPGT
jgi:enoyl-[acyl-carrier-protein] reductase (NADH)